VNALSQSMANLGFPPPLCFMLNQPPEKRMCIVVIHTFDVLYRSVEYYIWHSDGLRRFAYASRESKPFKSVP
jgi:hypothetical protein